MSRSEKRREKQLKGGLSVVPKTNKSMSSIAELIMARRDQKQNIQMVPRGNVNNNPQNIFVEFDQKLTADLSRGFPQFEVSIKIKSILQKAGAKDQMVPGLGQNQFVFKIENNVQETINALKAFDLVKEVSIRKEELPKEKSSLDMRDRQKKLIFEDAIKNKEYYLRKQAEARANGQEVPWFYFPRKELQHSEFVMLNTQMAKELLAAVWTEQDGNRKVKYNVKEAYKRDILNDCWIPSDESIGIDYNHVVYNGRHRLTALIESEKEWPFYISFNCLEDAKFTVDSGAKRSSGEKLSMVVDSQLGGGRTTGFLRALMRGVNANVKYSETEIAEFANQWQPLITWIHKHLPKGKAEVQAAVAKAYLFYGPDKIEEFCQRLRGVEFGTKQADPAKALFFALNRSKVNRINVTLSAYKKTLNAIDYDLRDKELYKVHEKEDDVFEWGPDWSVPEESWWAKNHQK